MQKSAKKLKIISRGNIQLPAKTKTDTGMKMFSSLLRPKVLSFQGRKGALRNRVISLSPRVFDTMEGQVV